MVTKSLVSNLPKILNHKPSRPSPINRGPGDITWDEGVPTFGTPTSHMPNKFIEWIFNDLDIYKIRTPYYLYSIKILLIFGNKT